MTVTHTNGADPMTAALSVRAPLYLQVRDGIRARIAAGQYKRALPNEGDLAREIGVSQGTMRKALDVLEEEGVIERHQGRGTFIRELVDWNDLPASTLAAARFISATGPHGKPAKRELAVAGGSPVKAEQLRHLAAGLIELAAWADLRAIRAEAEEGR